MITAGLQYTEVITLETIVCYKCGIPFGVPSNFKRACLQEGPEKTFYCPNGHGQVYTKSTSDKLKEKFDQEKESLIKANDLAWDTVYKIRTEKNNLEKQLKRVKNGVCPCCNRSFKDLKKHMQTKHSIEFSKSEPKK